MTLGEALRDHLLDHAPLVALVGSRIYPQVIAQSAAMPAIAYTVVGDVPTNALCGTGLALRNVRVQIDVVARDLAAYDTAQNVADAVDAAMTADAPTFRALRLTRQDGYEREPQMHTVRLDFSLWWQP